MRLALPTLLILSMLAIGCPSDNTEAGPVEECTQAGQQCKMGGGQLGVCTPDLETDPPKLFCMSQH